MSEDTTQKDLHLIFTTSVEDIKFAKLQQWRITYYAFLLMGGTFYLRISFQLHWFLEFVFRSAPPIISGIVIWLIIKIEQDMIKYRYKIVQTRGCLSDEFLTIHKVSENYLKTVITFKNERFEIPVYRYEFLLIQIITLYIAAFLLPFIN